MTIQEMRIAKAERRVREAEANVERQKQKLQSIEAGTQRSGLGPAREVLMAFNDLLLSTRLRLRELRHRHKRDGIVGGQQP